MKQFQIGEDRVVVVRKKEGDLEVVIRDKKSDKSVVFTPERFVVLYIHF
jgi:hypothetical protein